MEFLPPEIDRYAAEHSQAESDILKKINRDTWSEVLMPRMLSGHMQGRILSMLSKMIKPKKILEIGTYTGYSAICLAEGLQNDGLLLTIDINDELESRVRNYFSQADPNGRIKYMVGNALNIIPQLEHNWDLVFIDADKINYQKYLDLVYPFLNKGAWVIADNVLWSGKILGNSNAMDEDTKALHDYNEKIIKDSRFCSVLMPVRDGLMISQKL